MPDTLTLEVATPERELVAEQVSEVELPGKNGYMGILPGHAPLLAQLGIGTLMYEVEGKRRYLSVHCGFVEINGGRVRVLADIAERAEEIDVQRAEAAHRRALEESLNPALGVDPGAALEAMERAQARIDTAGLK